MFSIWNSDYQLVLASGSPTRRRLLEEAGLPFIINAPHVDERGIEIKHTRADGAELAQLLARATAKATTAETSRAICLGADQTLSLRGRIFHKSPDREAARRTLAALSGQTHQLASAFSLFKDGQEIAHGLDVADLTLRVLSDAQIELYLDAAGPGVLSSVGVYQWESFGVHLFERVAGDHTTILGMPMLKLLAALRSLGALRL